jgi:hypothetical protein
MKKKIYDIVFASQYEELTTKEATDQILVLFGVVGRSEQLVCDYCGKDKVEDLDHCECYNGTAWVKKAN